MAALLISAGGSTLTAILVVMLQRHMTNEDARAAEAKEQRDTTEAVLRELVRAMDRAHPELAMRLPPGW